MYKIFIYRYYMSMLDMINKCGIHTYTSLYPTDVDNRVSVLLINTVHIIGVLVIQLGILLPPHLLKYYILYIVFLFITYTMLNNRCFMTVLSNYIGNKNYNSLCIKMSQAKKILLLYGIIGVIFYIYPKYALYTMITEWYTHHNKGSN
jgi:hypothetical protein